MDNITKIQQIDARYGEISDEIRRLDGIAAAAESVANAEVGLAVEVEQVQAKRRRTVGDLLLGLVRREDVAVLDNEVRDIEQRAAQAREDAELRRMGAAEIRERTQPLHAERARLDQQRDRLCREHVREQAELAARRYRDHLLAAANELAEIAALGNVLATMEKIGTPREVDRSQRLSFQMPGIAVLEAPAIDALQPLSDARGGLLRIAIDPMARAGCATSINFPSIAERVETELRAAGVLR